ncbi:EDD domain protein, DegV family [Ligilactobacillus hayakitensis DSM 18933 = JCM 14209]|uniref:EDD domain protein, DegV family n=1 Tax=Ligilactobacillus hayakitensis DSM 18933 = JCM 14209 TaxID=1423755 RepID=A0A0R1WXQ2_9LACO|nr:DegV family protein [Ligilactobacillus hayakitensis]KRM19635.1 EDD domain protein, DegV family [Ligilactobacillus hayakitensis DSM 18933 = JCM 14209]
MKIAILTDSSAVIDENDVEKFNIHILEFNIGFEGGRYLEKQGMTQEMKREMLLENTSTPVIESVSDNELDSFFSDLKTQEYTDYIFITLANGISSFPKVLENYAKTSDLKIHVFDSYASGANQGYLVKLAAKKAAEGADVAAIIDHLKALRDNSATFLLSYGVNQLTKTGYMSNGHNSVSNRFLKPKTLMRFTNQGKLSMYKTHYREKSSYDELKAAIMPMYEKFGKKTQITLMGILNNKKYQEYEMHLNADFTDATIKVVEIPLSLAIFLGSKGIAVAVNEIFE